jgi:TonB family protein
VGAVKRRLRSQYVTPPEFLNRALVTMLQVLLTAEGEVLGTPEVVLGSGDPFWDDNAIRTVKKASPLPPPPEAGTWTFTFSSEGR